MSKETSHIVLTRFNLAIRFKYSRNDTEIPVESEAPWLDLEYLEKRFRIFEKYTFPSFLGQTDKDFKWIVMFHKETPEVFKSKIQEYTDKMPQMEVWYMDDEECARYKDILRDYIQENFEGNIITTRVDNDDVLHESFIEDCKKSFANVKELSVLTYINGYQYDSRNDTVINYDFINNHFLSLYVPNGEKVDHILTFNHMQIDKGISERSIRKIEKRTKIPMWVEIITETNCANHLIWRMNSFAVPYNIEEEYPTIKVKWNSKMQWLCYVIAGTCKTPFYRISNLLNVLSLKK